MSSGWFRTRLNCLDHYQSKPTHFDPALPYDLLALNKQSNVTVPVIRVFGSTESGQKVCIHVHGAFPYLYIEYDGDLAPEIVGRYIQQLRLAVDHALAVSYRRNTQDGKATFVAYISLVKGVPFYGFHVGYKYYLKIYLLNPNHMTRFADLLRQGTIMKRKFQPYESHMQYLAQWMCDYNLFGCAYIDCKSVMFRGPVPESGQVKPGHEWHDQTISSKLISSPTAFPKQSHCAIEVDLMVEAIANRSSISVRELHHDFVERQFPLDTGAKFVTSMAGLWKDETNRRKAAMSNPKIGSSPFPPEVLISMSADTRQSSQKAGWIHEEEFAEKIIQKIEAEKTEGPVTFENYIAPKKYGDEVQTALGSVEDLHSDKIRSTTTSFSEYALSRSHLKSFRTASTDVDEVKIKMSQYDSESDDANGSRVTISRNGKAYKERSQQHENDLDETVAELESLGVRSHGDTSHYMEDVFPIPEEFQSAALTNGTPQSSRDQEAATEHTPSPSKRRRLNDSASTTPTNRSERKVHSFIKPKNGRIQRGSLNPGDSPSSYQKPPGSQESISSSQETIKITDTSTIKSFQVSKSFRTPHKSPSRSRQLSHRSDKSKASRSTESHHTTNLSSFRKKSSTWTSNSFGSTPADPQYQKALRVAARYSTSAFSYSGHQTLLYAPLPPGSAIIDPKILQTDHLPVIYQDAYYSSEKDVPEKARDYAGREFRLESTTAPFLPSFDPFGFSDASRGFKAPNIRDKRKEQKIHRKRSYACKLKNWDIAKGPPSRKQVEEWFKKDQAQKYPLLPAKVKSKPQAQIEGPTQKNAYGAKFSQNKRPTALTSETQYMSIMSLEIHANTRGELLPDPKHDSIACIFWAFRSDDVEFDVNCRLEGTYAGCLALCPDEELSAKIRRETGLDIDEEDSELDVINRIVDIVRILDPDILTGFEVHNGSWGFLIERARSEFDFNLCDQFSRMRENSHGRFGKENDRWGFNNTSSVRVTGRHMINVWRAMQSELALLQYTLENVAFQLLQKRVPHYAWKSLTQWYTSGKSKDIGKVLDYHLSRCLINLEILEQTEIIPRTSEQARLLGVDFYSVFSRGSQFKVESLMLRIAKPENLILISPDRRQVGGQNALECLPLVMEPQSNFYNSPLLVLDFQSLYPSVMIAYNYCYSTFIGRVNEWRGNNKMGFTNYERQDRLLELLKDQINISPNGMMYCKPEIRKSLLAKMLSEILETRVMVKSGMKIDKNDKPLQRLLNNRQLALKLIANVTYGYTSASFSGRMPCSEIADSIVQTARETLERTIAFIHSVDKWGAEVVYGDTDSLFIYLKGRTKDEAFDIGEDIARTVTNQNPRPMKLKFEKVYLPCVLLAKKRYVGYKYESRNQKVPEFDAKGIETVRRDGTPAEQKIEERALRILFETADLSRVKKYFQSQCDKIMKGNVSIQDFCFAKEVRLGTYSDKGPPPPGALISTRKMLADPRAEPQYGERVPYVVITGAPGARLIDRTVAPEILLEDDQSELDAEYYISKNLVPPLERIFNLVGANVRSWYEEMPKTQRIRAVATTLASAAAAGASAPTIAGQAIVKKTLESYMNSSICLVCRSRIEQSQTTAAGVDTTTSHLPPSAVCQACVRRPDHALLTLRRRRAAAERSLADIMAVCRSCSGLAHGEEVRCDSKDCNVYYSRVRQMARLKSEIAVEDPLIMFLESSATTEGQQQGEEGGFLEW